MTFVLPILIIGQGLAGTALAWRLWDRKVPFVILDRDEAVTSSKIAAGLLTPITGMRISLSENYGPWLCEAVTFYRAKERQLGVRFLHASPHVRLFKNDEEPARWHKRAAQPEVSRFVNAHARSPLVNEAIFSNPRGGFQMKHGGWLETEVYLTASRRFFAAEGCVQTGEFQHEALELNADNVRWNGQQFSHAVLCTGWEAMRHPLFSWVPFEPARGTILTARADLQGERRVLHAGCWVSPRPDGTLRLGSTYEKTFDDPHGHDEAKLDDLHRKLRALIQVPVEILAQQAAVRPIIARQRTLVGTHPAVPRLAFFNGLGSKGTLRSPYFARCLAEHLLDGTPIPAAQDVRGNM